jgi:hypothetical protein
MKKIHLALFVLLFSVSIFGQTAQQNSDPIAQNQKPLKIFTGEEYMPYLFEAYQADYAFKGKIIGIDFDVFSFTSRIVELQDEWEETQIYHLPMIPDEEFRDIKITSTIDLKTGLLKKMVTETGKNISQTIEIGDGKIFISETNGRKTKSIAFDAKEKIYPCNYSNTFLSYLPLKDDFAGSFFCFTLDENDSGKPKIKFLRRTLRVVGTENVSTPAGFFECYKLADDAEEIVYERDGKIKERKKKKQIFDEEKFWANFYSNTWIDKKTREVIKGELNFKIGNVGIEMQRSKYTNL